MDYIIKRMREPTTWAGLITLVGALGYSIKPEHQDVFIQGGLFLTGIIGVLTKDI